MLPTFAANNWHIESTKQVILYIVSIILYIISFIHLNKKGSSEYVAYIFVFILNVLTPFIWLGSYRDIVFNNFGNFSHMYENGKGNLGNILMQYRSWGIYITFFLLFLSMLFVLMKNEDVRRMLKMNKDDENMREGKSNLDTLNKTTEQNDKSIFAILVTIIVTIWSLVGHTFSLPTEKDYGVSFFENMLYIQESYLQKDNTGFIRNIRWLLTLPKLFIQTIETKWMSQMDRIRTTPLVKSFSFYCITFIAVFFGIFVRIPIRPHRYKIMDRFNIVNMESPFPQKFERNIHSFRDFSMFVLCSLISIVLAIIMYTFGKSTSMSKGILQFLTSAFVIIIFASMFGKKFDILPDSASVKSLIFFFLSIVFGLLGTPVILGILQIFTETGIFELPIKAFSEMLGTPISYARTLNVGSLLNVLFMLIFLFLTFFIFGFGMKNNWVSNDNGKSMTMFNVILVCMALSLYVGLSTSYPISTLLYSMIKNTMEVVLIFIAPLALVILAIVQFIFAFKNHEKYKRFGEIKKNS